MTRTAKKPRAAMMNANVREREGGGGVRKGVGALFAGADVGSGVVGGEFQGRKCGVLSRHSGGAEARTMRTVRTMGQFHSRAQYFYSSLVMLPARTVGSAMRDKWAEAIAMYSEVAHSFAGLIHFPHHETVAFSLHLVYCTLMLRP